MIEWFLDYRFCSYSTREKEKNKSICINLATGTSSKKVDVSSRRFRSIRALSLPNYLLPAFPLQAAAPLFFVFVFFFPFSFYCRFIWFASRTHFHRSSIDRRGVFSLFFSSIGFCRFRLELFQFPIQSGKKFRKQNTAAGVAKKAFSWLVRNSWSF